jgi:hypothetical protein
MNNALDNRITRGRLTCGECLGVGSAQVSARCVLGSLTQQLPRVIEVKLCLLQLQLQRRDLLRRLHEYLQ